MGKSIFFWLGLFLVGSLAMGGGVLLWFAVDSTNQKAPHQNPDVLSATQTYEELPNIEAIVTTEQEVSRQRNPLICSGAQCSPVTNPPPTNSEIATFDGDSWLAYSENGDLEIFLSDGTRKVIATPAALIKPRGIIPSPNGKLVAYWMDNTTEEGDGLTELWVYNKQEESSYVIVENIYAPDIVTAPQWNTASTNLSFIVDSGEGESEKLEFIVASAQSLAARASFMQIGTAQLQPAAQKQLLDISGSKVSLAFAEETGRGNNKINIVRENSSLQSQSLSGRVVHIHWVDEATLVYAVQRTSLLEFWRFSGNTHQLISRHRGVLISAKPTLSGEYLTFISQDGLQLKQMHILELATGLLKTQAALPANITSPAIVRAEEEQTDIKTTPEVTAEFSDAELIAFVEKHANQMTEGKGAKLTRIITTDKINTLLVDYETSDQSLKRLQITIRDILHPEWTVAARFEAEGPNWIKTKGRGEAELEPNRVYEWESSIERWILKQGEVADN